MHDHRSDDGFDQAALLAEIDADVRRRRARGDLPADVERELDEVFARFAPPAAIDADLRTYLERLSQTTFIDVDAPTDSVRPGVSHVKRALRKSMAWYFRHMAQQVSSLAQSLITALTKAADRIAALEAAVPATSPAVERLTEGLPPIEPADDVGSVVETLKGTTGRVAHVGAGPGRVVEALRAVGVDAYGVEADHRLVDQVDDLLVRRAEATDHVRSLGPEVLGAMIVSTDSLSWVEQATMLVEAPPALVPGGLLVISGSEPGSLGEGTGPARAALGVAHAMDADAWVELMSAAGLEGVASHDSARGTVLVSGRRPGR